MSPPNPALTPLRATVPPESPAPVPVPDVLWPSFPRATVSMAVPRSPLQSKVTSYCASTLASTSTVAVPWRPSTSVMVSKTPEETVTEGTSQPSDFSATVPPGATVAGVTEYPNDVTPFPVPSLPGAPLSTYPGRPGPAPAAPSPSAPTFPGTSPTGVASFAGTSSAGRPSRVGRFAVASSATAAGMARDSATDVSRAAVATRIARMTVLQITRGSRAGVFRIREETTLTVIEARPRPGLPPPGSAGRRHRAAGAPAGSGERTGPTAERSPVIRRDRPQSLPVEGRPAGSQLRGRGRPAPRRRGCRRTRRAGPGRRRRVHHARRAWTGPSGSRRPRCCRTRPRHGRRPR